MNHISTILNSKKKEFGWSYQKISTETNIHKDTVGHHLRGDRNVSETDLIQYCKCFNLQIEDMKENYLDGIDICNKDTLKTIVATTTAIGVSAGVGALVFNGIQTLINNHCKKDSKSNC